MSKFEQKISEYIWDLKYRHKINEKIQDQTIEDTWHRVAHAAASTESFKERNYWEKKFYQLLEDFVFLPGGRILAGAGTNKKVTLFNCFVMRIQEDSLKGIFEALKEGALTLQEGGGIGYDFSILRPRGSHCIKSNSIASGPISFMRIWDTMSATMLSSGARRGAMMANLRCDHPDILEFIDIKSQPNELRHFNLSVIITDEFINAVKMNKKWPLVFPTNKKNHSIMRRWSGGRFPVACEVLKTIDARGLWEKIIKAAYTYAEPGVIFEDTINQFNPLWYCEWISATNPCAEIPLPYYGACNLGSINLTRFIKNPFTSQADINWTELESVSEMATRFLDNIIDITHYPLPAQRAAAFNSRRIGLGFTGLANVFVMLNMPYGDKQSLRLARDLTQKIAYTAWQSSALLGNLKGSFPLYDRRYHEGQFVLSLPDYIRKDIKKYGMRNSHHNAIAPTGSISLLANNVSGGLEPIFSAKYNRIVRNKSDEKILFEIEDYAFLHFTKKFGQEKYPDAWRDITSLSPNDHLAIQSAIQPYIDNAISKTINIPEDFPFEKLVQIYQHAYDLGLKGCTIFRPNPTTGSVLTAGDIDPCCSIK